MIYGETCASCPFYADLGNGKGYCERYPSHPKQATDKGHCCGEHPIVQLKQQALNPPLWGYVTAWAAKHLSEHAQQVADDTGDVARVAESLGANAPDAATLQARDEARELVASLLSLQAFEKQSPGGVVEGAHRTVDRWIREGWTP